MQLSKITLIIMLGAILSGCGSKFYFEPKEEEIAGEVAYMGSLPDDIISVTRNGATLDNRQFITKYSQVPNVVLPEGARYLNQSEEYYIASTGDNKLFLFHKDTRKALFVHLEGNPVSASIDKNLIVAIFDNNTFVIYDLEQEKVIYKLDSAPAPTNNTLIASPYFLGDIIVVPTLDGKLVIVDRNKMQIIRNIVVNGEKHFNNVIFLEAINNRMVAATPKRVISVSPTVINTFDANLKDVLFFSDRIFLFTSEGEVILTDVDLNEIKRLKFPFAHFTAANHGQHIMVLETRGYLIILEDDLSDYKILKLPDAIDVPVFSGTDRIFVGDQVFEIK
ncbi:MULTISPECIES: hypothetical protein [Helicobacter]|uniref:Lipoprotein n=1 Tax=Helicobacter ibis TaxID=2962633 RepID=A0ABT4VC54_9HELI|nr:MULTISPECIES: hypothetical protein [Helicobacter]MDA3967526.1 hypothetical protein [Helicobacter sp. WB40]MDA3968274.1 hypothetical protein [Helicobacter ibis]